ncbi:MAG: hypothetical protein KJ063_24805 [Anaerolineae bacterium]|nr:hypothetical protein [Anaerolineae bacterium]
MQTQNPEEKPKRRNYWVVAVIEEQSCPLHGTAMVSELPTGQDGVPEKHKEPFCPLCKP